MRFSKFVGIAGLVLALGCSEKPQYKTYADLNNDNIPDIVQKDFNEAWGYMGYDLTARLSQPDGTYSEPRVIKRFKEEPYHIEFKDVNSDGYADLVFTKIDNGKYKTYVMINDEGNFKEPKRMK